MALNFEPGFIFAAEKHWAAAYTDTDSVYAIFAMPEDFDKSNKDNLPQLIKTAVHLADTINEEIDDTVRTRFVERANLDPDWQTLFFKTEMVGLRMLQYNIKKTYSYTKIYDEGEYLSEPKVSHTGGHVKKSSTPKISKDLLQEIVDVMLMSEVNSIQELYNTIFGEIKNKYTQRFLESKNKWQLSDFGIPYKYGFGKTVTKWMQGAWFFNTFFHDELRPGASMYSVYIVYNKAKLQQLLKDMKISKTDAYKMSADDVTNTFNMLSVPVENADKVYSKYKDQIAFLRKTIDFDIAYDLNYSFCIEKKVDAYQDFFR